jgi:thiosulfate/3-mercaptopyruvate sulfurtransferase
MGQRLSDTLVNAEWIATHLDDPTVRVIEVDVSGAAYNSGHIPGAVLWNTYTDLRHADYTPITTTEFERVLSRSGVTPESTVVFYGYAPHLGYWLMKSYGHKHAMLMDGPRDQWEAAGNSWTTEVLPIAPSQYPLSRPDPSLASSLDEVEAMVRQPGMVILDTRSPAEYDGERFWPSGVTEGAGRPGHIPGAVHVHIDHLRTSDGHFKDADEIRQILESRGVSSGTKVVIYCTIGNRASQAWFALKYLVGYTAPTVYYGSWAEWGSRSDTPIETGDATPLNTS